MVLNPIDFAYADFRNCDLRATVVDQCSLRDAKVARSRFTGADLRSAYLGGLRLVDTSLFDGATISWDQAGQLLKVLGLEAH